jgi:hypothetical protein
MCSTGGVVAIGISGSAQIGSAQIQRDESNGWLERNVNATRQRDGPA